MTDNIVSSLNNEVNINNQRIKDSEDISGNIWQRSNSSASSDEKPDLLEYNSTSPDYDSNSEEFHSQLPDLTTSVRAVGHCYNNYDVDSLSNSLDLISSTSVNHLKENEQVKHDLVNCEVYESDHLEKINESNSPFNQDNCLPNRDVPNLKSKLVGFADALQSTSVPEIDSDRQATIEASEKAELLSFTQNVTSEIKSFIAQNIAEDNSTTESVDENKRVIENKDNELAIESRQAQDETVKIPKAVGFSAASDVSEEDIEEYLKELEDLDETALLKKPLESNTSDVESLNTFCKVSCDDQVELNLNGSTILSNTCIENKTSDHDLSKTKDLDDHNHRTNNTVSQIIKFGLKDLDERNSEYDINNLKKTDVCSSSVDMSLGKNIKPQNTISSSDFSQEINTTAIVGFKLENNSGETSVKIANDKNVSQPKDSSNINTESNFEKVYEKEKPTTYTFSNCDITMLAVSPEISTNPFEVEYKEILPEGSKQSQMNPFDDNNEDNDFLSEDKRHSQTNPLPFNNDGTITDENSTIHLKRHLAQCWEGKNPSEEEESISELVTEPRSPISSTHSEDFETEPAFIDPNTSLMSETNMPNEIGTEVNVCSEDPPPYSDVMKTSSSSYSSNVDIGEIASALSLPGCSSSYKSLESSAKMIPVKAAVESASSEGVDEAGVPAEEDRPLRPSSLELQRKITVEPSVVPPPDLPGIGFDFFFSYSVHWAISKKFCYL